MESVQATPEVQSLIAKAFEASDNSASPNAEQYLVIPPDHVNEEVIVIDTTNTDAHHITRFKVASAGSQSSKEKATAVQSLEQPTPMECTTSLLTRQSGHKEMAAASSIVAMQSSSESKPLTFEVIDSASQRGLPKLMDSMGYGYTLRRTSKVNARSKRAKGKGQFIRRYWRCAVRGKQFSCSAAVTQDGDDIFIRNDHEHGHLPKPDSITQVKLKKQIKMMAKQNSVDTSPALVNSVLLENADGEEVECNRAFHANLVRAANRIREKMKDKVDYTVEMVLQNVYQYFLNEDRAGTVTNLNNPLKRLSEASGMPLRQVKKRLGITNQNEIAIKRCVGGEYKSPAKIAELQAKEAMGDIINELEHKNIHITSENLMTAFKLKHPEINITSALLAKTLRGLGYQTKSTKVWDIALDKKMEEDVKPDISALNRSR